MSTNPLPILPQSPRGQAKIDRLGWTAGQSFTAYGLRFGLRSNHPVALEQTAPTSEVDILYSLRLAGEMIQNEHG